MEALSTTIGAYAPDFELPGADGAVHHLARYLENYKAVGVVFMCNHCPYVQMYVDRLKQIQQTFAHQGFTIIGINPNDADQYPADGYEQMQEFTMEKGLNFPYLRDMNQDVAHTFGAEKTPHVFLVNQNGVICYSGAIDDSAQDANAVTQRFFETAIAATLKGEAIANPQTEPVGCSVKWRK
jgi:peroxiredoxin